MKLLSCGAGMQSTALALMSCEKALSNPELYPEVPVYDAVIFCDLGLEPVWVKRQVDFTGRACEKAGIPFYILDTPLYQDFMRNFGQRRTVSIPWWTLTDDGHKSKMPRSCTIDYKVEMIAKFIRWALLGYKKGQRLRVLSVPPKLFLPMKSMLFISRSRKRITNLTPEDCSDAECFEYCGQQVWNGF